MACSHQSCPCQITGCGLDHPDDWAPAITININGIYVGGDDSTDCMAHYLLQAGYPADQPDHIRKIAQLWAAKRLG